MRSILRNSFSLVAAILIVTLFQLCSEDSNDVLAPYQGHRALNFIKVTQGYVPDLQWLGGRVAAVGVNKGEHVSLDSTLVYLHTSESDTIESPVRFGYQCQKEKIGQMGGTPADSLIDGETYTFWVAEKDIYEDNLDSSSFDGFNLTDTTVFMGLSLRGLGGGGNDIDISIIQDIQLLRPKYVISWEPSDSPVRTLILKEGAGPGYDDVLWHIATPDSVDDNILPPLVVGETPPNVEDLVRWEGAQFETRIAHYIWTATSDWNGSFSPVASGFAYFRIFAL